MKKILSFILAVTMLVSLSSSALGDNAEKKTSATSLPVSDWALDDVEKAKELKLINYGGNYNYPSAVTREDFCELIYNYCLNTAKELPAVSGEKPFVDTDNEHIHILNTMGIINGKSETEFAPKDYLTREEAAVILFRLINTVHSDWAAHELYYEFEDNGEISDWAMDSIQTICNMGIMKGVGENKFSPKGLYTTEQAIVTVVRAYENFAVRNPEIIGGADAVTSIIVTDNATFADKVNAMMPSDENYMFSPLSVKMALMMAANGAEGKTREEIMNAVGVEDIDAYNENVKTMIEKYSQSEILKLNIANSVWINSDKTTQKFSDNYVKTVKDNFNAVSDTVTNKDAVDKINSWVNDKTNGKIPTIISSDNDSFWAMLVNAVYFKGRWQNEFRKSATKKDTFTSRDGNEQSIDFMNRTAWINCAKSDDITIVELPYLTREDIFDENGDYVDTKVLDGVDVSMYLLTSDGEYTAEEVLKNAKFSSQFTALSVPKFNVEYSAEMKNLLNSVGVSKAFTKEAEFDKMFDSGNMQIDSVLHKTYIKVDEEGTEAAAVTAVGMAGSAMPPEPIEVKFDKPFTFVIKDNTNGEILFMGEYAFAE